MKAPYQAYAVARFDGSVMFSDCKIGISPISQEQSLVVLFKILAGIQQHPVYAFDELAVRVYAYCKTAKDRNLRPMQLGASVTATPVSNESITTLILNHIEWHTDVDFRNSAESLYNRLRASNNIPSWPKNILNFPTGIVGPFD